MAEGILDKIMAERRSDAERAMQEVPERALRERAAGMARRSLRAALAAGAGSRIIAELKRSSPSAGSIRAGVDPAAVASAYEAAGATGISVLTEPRHFGGSPADLEAVRAAVSLPVLRKDFITTPYQVHEAAAWGADVVLLIVAGLAREEIRPLYMAAVEAGLETLAEVHVPDELALALACEQAVIGVNSRNLKTLETDLAVARQMGSLIPANRLSIAESGIETREDILELEALGYDGFLVGGSLMRAERPEEKLRELLGKENPSECGS